MFTLVAAKCSGKLTRVLSPSLAIAGCPMAPNWPKVRISPPTRSCRTSMLRLAAAAGVNIALRSVYFSASRRSRALRATASDLSGGCAASREDTNRAAATAAIRLRNDNQSPAGGVVLQVPGVLELKCGGIEHINLKAGAVNIELISIARHSETESATAR